MKKLEKSEKVCYTTTYIPLSGQVRKEIVKE